MMNKPQEITNRFDIPSGNTLKVQNKEKHNNKQQQCETCWYLEKDNNNQTIARYRTWRTTALLPPYRTQTGWERYTPDGKLLAREVRYSEHRNTQCLH